MAQAHFDKMCVDHVRKAIVALKKIDKTSTAGKAVATKVGEAIGALETIEPTFFNMAKGCAGIGQLDQYKDNCNTAIENLKKAKESEGKEDESDEKK